MAFDNRSLDDYVDVATRLADFRHKYPEGSLQPVDPANPWEQATVTGYSKDGKQFTSTMIVYKAAAYRTPDDPRPGIGVAWEVFPGRTPYTLGSELMNAETSAWGRAILAVLASDSKAGVASRQEVKARRLEREDGLPVNKDGSLSRSQTTDAEKDAARNMTSAQWAEHSDLQKGVNGKLPEAEQGTRATATPPDDLFYDQPPPSDEMPREQLPGTASRAQLGKMHALFGDLGIGKDQRDERLALTREIIGHDVKSASALSFVDAQKLNEVLEKRVKAAVTVSP